MYVCGTNNRYLYVHNHMQILARIVGVVYNEVTNQSAVLRYTYVDVIE